MPHPLVGYPQSTAPSRLPGLVVSDLGTWMLGIPSSKPAEAFEHICNRHAVPQSLAYRPA